MVEAQSDNLLPDGQEDQLQEEINPAFDLMHEGNSIRSVVTF